MRNAYEARWISKEQVDALRKSGRLNGAVVLDSFNGFILVAPAGSGLADGKPLSREEAQYELSPAWVSSPLPRLTRARQLLGLDARGLATASA
jgi:hypothetical protein